MRRTVLLTLLMISGFVLSAHAQEDFYSSRLNNFANDLKRSTTDLVDRTSGDIRRGSSMSRSAIEEAFLANQFDASAGLFQDMVSARKSANELRDAASILSDLSRRVPSYGSNGYLWRNVQNSVNDINRELGSGGGNNGGNNGGGWDNRPKAGRVYWKGMVDDKVQLVIKDRTLEQRTISGTAYPNGNFNFTTALPSRNVQIEVDKSKGRGSVRVIQQPSRSNDFTTIIEVRDDGGGAREYELEIFWR